MSKLPVACVVALSLVVGTPLFSAEAGTQNALLPSGYLSTSGNQIVDQKGNSVRLVCVGYDEPGTSIDAIKNDIRSMLAYGFNCLRSPWYNATLRSVNLPVMKNIVAAAAANGMKVIFDHHGDEAPSAANGYLPYPGNGLPYDVGPGTDGKDGSGDTGTVTREIFTSDWVFVASQFKNNPTVIGFDLTNEPRRFAQKGTLAGATWGDGGTNDLVPLYKDTGNAMLAVNPDALIICEGILNYLEKTFSKKNNVIQGLPDLSGVQQHPVVLKNAHKLVYSIHDYPNPIGDTTPDSGNTKIAAMNTSWGYIVSSGRAPVWIGEMGASLDLFGADVTKNSKTPSANLADERAWAASMVTYLNGGFGNLGGPTFKTCEAGIGIDWWRWGSFDGESPDGTLDDHGKPRSAQKSITDQLGFVPRGRCQQ